MTFDTEVTTEVSDRIAEIGRRTLPVAKPAAYDSPEGILFRRALALIAEERNWCGTGASNSRGGICSFVALQRCGASDLSIAKVAVALYRTVNGDGFVSYNDSHTHTEVIARWHEAGRANGWLL